MTRLGWPLLALSLSGCGAMQTYQARTATNEDSLVRRGIWDVLPCLGIPAPDHRQRITDDLLLLQYDYSNSDAGMTIEVLTFGVKIGGPGQCKLVLEVERRGTIYDAAFPQAHVAGLGPDSAACGALVAECIKHPNNTERPAGYDAFRFLLPPEVTKDQLAAGSPPAVAH